jgi:transposase
MSNPRFYFFTNFLVITPCTDGCDIYARKYLSCYAVGSDKREVRMRIRGSFQGVSINAYNLKVHHAYIVKDWLAQAEIKQKLELFWLPSYSPELNPDEYLNCDLKRGLSDKPAPKNIKELHKNVENHMNMLQQTPDRVVKYFKQKDIKYAA